LENRSTTISSAYGREEQDEEEERMQRVEGVTHPG